MNQSLAIDAKDQYTHQHILRVQRYAVALAKKMGLTGSLLEAVNTGALLHDIGKLGVPEYVLMKPGRLDAVLPEPSGLLKAQHGVDFLIEAVRSANKASISRCRERMP